MKQAHFVVVVEESGNVFIDYETAMALMPDGVIYENGWISEYEHADFYESTSKFLGDLLRPAKYKKGN